jgi:hypothetical protein
MTPHSEVAPDPQKIDHFFGESVERQKNKETVRTNKMSANYQKDFITVKGEVSFTPPQLVYFIRGFYGKENPFGDDDIHKEMEKMLWMIFALNHDDGVLPHGPDEHLESFMTLAHTIADLQGIDATIPIELHTPFTSLLIKSCGYLIQLWIFFGVFDKRMKLWKENTMETFEEQIKHLPADLDTSNIMPDNQFVWIFIETIAAEIKKSIQHAGFDTTQFSDKIGYGRQVYEEWYKQKTSQLEDCAFSQGATVIDNDVTERFEIKIELSFIREYICVACEKRCHGFGNNAAPVYDGFCCDNCNGSVIVRRRILHEAERQIEVRRQEMEMEAQLKREAIEKELLSQGNVKVICEKPKTKKQLQAEATREANNVKKAADKAKKEYEKACEISRLARAKSAQDKQKKILKAKRDNQIKCALAYATKNNA